MAKIHFSDYDILEMQNRYLNGPFKTDNDAYIDASDNLTIDTQGTNFINNEGVIEWFDIWADEFLAGGTSEAIFDTPPQYPEPNQSYPVYGWKPQHCALRYLLSGDTNDSDAVRNFLLAQVDVSTMDFSTWIYYSHNTNPNGVFHAANWTLRLLYAYDYIKETFSAGEQTTMNTWFLNAATYFDDNVHEVLKILFDGRRNRDYTPVSGSSADTGNYAVDQMTHWEANGDPGTQIHWVAKQYNNRASSQMAAVGVIANYLDDATLIDRAKMYFEEWLKFGVYLDGTQAEYERNNDYGHPMTGTLYYGAINISSCIYVADIMNRNGDNSLYEYSTSDGLFSSVGGPKNLKLVIDRNCAVINQEVDWYSDKNNQNSTYHIDQYSNVQDKTSVHDTTFALANKYYNDPYLRDTNRRQATQDPPLSGHDTNAVNYPGSRYYGSGTHWWGHGGAPANVLSPLFSWDNMSLEVGLSIAGIYPVKARVGETVLISGIGFDNSTGNNTVKFNNISAIVTQATTTSLRVTVPSGDVNGIISVTVSAVTVNYNSFSLYIIHRNPTKGRNRRGTIFGGQGSTL